MLLKTFLAKDMSHALAQVRAELGDEAVIIGTQKAKDGTLLVRAAVEEAQNRQLPRERQTRFRRRQPRWSL